MNSKLSIDVTHEFKSLQTVYHYCHGIGYIDVRQELINLSEFPKYRVCFKIQDIIVEEHELLDKEWPTSEVEKKNAMMHRNICCKSRLSVIASSFAPPTTAPSASSAPVSAPLRPLKQIPLASFNSPIPQELKSLLPLKPIPWASYSLPHDLAILPRDPSTSAPSASSLKLGDHVKTNDGKSGIISNIHHSDYEVLMVSGPRAMKIQTYKLECLTKIVIE